MAVELGIRKWWRFLGRQRRERHGRPTRRRRVYRRISSCRGDVPQANFIECKAFGSK